MSDFTRQCVECAKVFDWSGKGRPPGRCDPCKAAHEERMRNKSARENGKRNHKPKRRAKARASKNGALVDYAALLQSLELEIEELERGITVRREAVEALEAITGAARG